jgi:phenylacetic acid degradation operon negative regulatory protein
MKRKHTRKPMLEDWLPVLIWTGDVLSRPTWHNLFRSLEAVEHEDRFLRQLRYLEQRAMLREERGAGQWVYRLTELGRLVALGGRDPQARWNRQWDGQWRMVLFDLPTAHQSLRQQLLRWFRQNGFGYLQNSVWIHPNPLDDLSHALDKYRDDVEALTIMEARCCAGYANEAIVRGAWDFDEINKRYEAYLDGFGKHAPRLVGGRLGFAEASQWLRSERLAWEHAVSLDPMLPRSLLPDGYRGVAAWQARRRLLRTVAEQTGAVE